MFCPTCGKDNALGRKFCVACGTNLDAVSQALRGSKTDFFTRTDTALDQLIARYAEHVFKDAPASTDTSIASSWKILGQGILTSLMDMVLFSLMLNIFPIRLLILLISSPIRFLYGRSQKEPNAELGERPDYLLQAAATIEMFPQPPAASVSEQTTERLQEPQQR